MNRDKELQKEVMFDILKFINKYDKQTTILKGGTALMFGYHLDRFSEDIDLDSTNKNLGKLIKEYCDIHKYGFSIKKDTNTVKRFMLEYQENRKIKIEISYRNKTLSKDSFTNINGIDIYKIDRLMGMKINAYNGRDKIRDLYDIVFIMKNYKNEISDTLIDILKNSFEYKGLDQFDYLIRTQSDSLIDNDKLAEDFLLVYDSLGLIDEDESNDEINDIEETEDISVGKSR